MRDRSNALQRALMHSTPAVFSTSLTIFKPNACCRRRQIDRRNSGDPAQDSSNRCRYLGCAIFRCSLTISPLGQKCIGTNSPPHRPQVWQRAFAGRSLLGDLPAWSCYGSGAPFTLPQDYFGVFPFLMEYFSHFFMDQIDSLQRADHYLEFCNLPFVVPLDHVDAVNGDAVNLQLKFQYSIAVTTELADVTK